MYRAETADAAARLECEYCGMIHKGVCPKVRSIEYHQDSTIKRVEFFESQNLAADLHLIKMGQGAEKIAPAPSRLEQLVTEYAANLRQNASGGDISRADWRQNESIADYLLELVKRSKAAP